MGFTTWLKRQVRTPTHPEYGELATRILAERAYPKGMRERLIFYLFLQTVGYNRAELELFDRMWATFEKEAEQERARLAARDRARFQQLEQKRKAAG